TTPSFRPWLKAMVPQAARRGRGSKVHSSEASFRARCAFWDSVVPNYPNGTRKSKFLPSLSVAARREFCNQVGQWGLRIDEQTETAGGCRCPTIAHAHPFLASLSSRPIRIRAALLVSKNNVQPNLLIFLPAMAARRLYR